MFVWFIYWRYTVLLSVSLSGWTPSFGTQYSGVLDGTQYAKGRYAVRQNPVMLYADIKFYFKKLL